MAAVVEALGNHPLPHGEPGQLVSVPAEMVQLVVLPAEKLGQQYARHRERLLGHRRHPGH